MKTDDRRLAKIETSLTPTQAMVLWLEDALQHDSFQAHARWLKEQPAAAYPLVRLPRQVRQAVRDAVKGQHGQDVDALVRRAERDVTFLFKLFMEVNAWVLEAQGADALGYLWLLERLRRFMGATPRQLREEAATWREHALPLASESYALAVMVEGIAQRYFGGHAVLFPAQAEALAQANRCWDTVLGLYTYGLEQLPPKQRQGLALTPEIARVGGQALAGRDMGYAVVKAKAETLRLFGEYDAAAALVEPYL